MKKFLKKKLLVCLKRIHVPEHILFHAEFILRIHAEFVWKSDIHYELFDYCILWQPGVVSCLVLWRSGRLSWTSRKQLMNSVSAVPCWNSWLTRLWWLATGRELLRSVNKQKKKYHCKYQLFSPKESSSTLTFCNNNKSCWLDFWYE